MAEIVVTNFKGDAVFLEAVKRPCRNRDKEQMNDVCGPECMVYEPVGYVRTDEKGNSTGIRRQYHTGPGFTRFIITEDD